MKGGAREEGQLNPIESNPIPSFLEPNERNSPRGPLDAGVGSCERWPKRGAKSRCRGLPGIWPCYRGGGAGAFWPWCFTSGWNIAVDIIEYSAL